MHNLVWFRSDLRTLDNPALDAALQGNPNAVYAVFYVTPGQWQAHDWGANKIGFVLSSVLELQKELASLNIDLEIRYCNKFKDIAADLLQYMQEKKCEALFYNQEYELNEQHRDLHVNKMLNHNNIKIHSYHGQVLIAPGVILTKQKTPYSVFTPFKRACYEYLTVNCPKVLASPKKHAHANNFTKKTLDPKYTKYLNNPILKQWPVGQKYANQVLQQFCHDKVNSYAENRDFPGINGTSKISPHLAVGSISVRQCFITAMQSNNPDTWVNELLWRDFYKHIIFHFPNICKGQNFNAKYNKIKWEDPEPNLNKWKDGKTGIPIVDAAMRQLVTTGWMHNRLRMIVAMFLTKNLLIDWRYGEKFFSDHLIDLDFASNNGGWQWSASTGTDAVPYFRIFNPLTQTERFDPKGDFIKHFCPEAGGTTYIKPIVDLAKSRARAIERFASLA